MSGPKRPFAPRERRRDDELGPGPAKRVFAQVALALCTAAQAAFPFFGATKTLKYYGYESDGETVVDIIPPRTGHDLETQRRLAVTGACPFTGGTQPDGRRAARTFKTGAAAPGGRNERRPWAAEQLEVAKPKIIDALEPYVDGFEPGGNQSGIASTPRRRRGWFVGRDGLFLDRRLVWIAAVYTAMAAALVAYFRRAGIPWR